MRRKLLLGLALASAIALLFPVAAAPNGDILLDNQTGAQTNITLEPSDGPNGQYAVINEDDEIELLFSPVENDKLDLGDGLSDDSHYVFESVFVINNSGDETAENVYITDNEDGANEVRFFQNSPDKSIEGKDNSTTLAGGEEIEVGVEIDTRGEPVDVSTFTIHAEGEDTGTSEQTVDDGGDGGTTSENTNDQETDGDTDETDGGDSGTGTTGAGGDGGDGGAGGDGGDGDDGDTGEENLGAGADGETGGDGGDGGTDEGGEEADTQGEVIQQPFIPLSEETLGGFVFRTLLLLILFVLAGAGLSTVTRRGLRLDDS